MPLADPRVDRRRQGHQGPVATSKLRVVRTGRGPPGTEGPRRRPQQATDDGQSTGRAPPPPQQNRQARPRVRTRPGRSRPRRGHRRADRSSSLAPVPVGSHCRRREIRRARPQTGAGRAGSGQRGAGSAASRRRRHHGRRGRRALLHRPGGSAASRRRAPPPPSWGAERPRQTPPAAAGEGSQGGGAGRSWMGGRRPLRPSEQRAAVG
jgi:hypothetical protein